MTEKRTSQQLAQLEKPLQENKGQKNHKIGVLYTYLGVDKTEPGKEATKFASEFTKEEIDLLKSLKPGDKFVVNKEEYSYTRADGSVGKGWKLSSIADESTYKPRIPTTQTKKEWKGKMTTNTTGTKSGYDTLGQQVGNCVSNSILSLGAGKTIEQYKERMLELAEAGNWLRQQLEKGINSTTSSNNNNTNTATTTTATNTTDLSDMFGTVDNTSIDFDDLEDIKF